MDYHELVRKITALETWPEGMSVEERNTAEGWRSRCLRVEKKLEDAYKRMRALDEEIAELRLQVEEAGIRPRHETPY